MYVAMVFCFVLFNPYPEYTYKYRLYIPTDTIYYNLWYKGDGHGEA